MTVMNEELRSRILKLKILLLDVDGVLTDGGLYYANSGERIKKFYVKDGTGIRLLQKSGLEIAFITGLESDLVSFRAEDLKVRHVIQDCFEKDREAEKLLDDLGFTWDQTAFIGDDLIDLGLMKKVGLAVATNDAVEEIKRVVHYITEKPGGRGAVREVCDLILRVREG